MYSKTLVAQEGGGGVGVGVADHGAAAAAALPLSLTLTPPPPSSLFLIACVLIVRLTKSSAGSKLKPFRIFIATSISVKEARGRVWSAILSS